jgi:hypothetical protein
MSQKRSDAGSHPGSDQRRAPERTETADAVAGLLVNLAERSGHLVELLSTLEREGRLETFVRDLGRADRGDDLAAVLMNLIDRTDQLETLVGALAEQPERMNALVADLSERAAHVDALVAELERTID